MNYVKLYKNVYMPKIYQHKYVKWYLKENHSQECSQKILTLNQDMRSLNFIYILHCLSIITKEEVNSSINAMDRMCKSCRNEKKEPCSFYFYA